MKFSDIREAIPLLTYLEQRLSWNHVRAKGGRRGPCPLCQRWKKKPFWIDTQTQRWYCHGCLLTGDVIDLHSRLTGVFLPIAASDLVESNTYQQRCGQT